jgi:hypothetical protein
VGQPPQRREAERHDVAYRPAADVSDEPDAAGIVAGWRRDTGFHSTRLWPGELDK